MPMLCCHCQCLFYFSHRFKMFWPKPMPVVVIMHASSNNILALKGTIFDAIFSVREIGNLERFMDCTNTTKKAFKFAISVSTQSMERFCWTSWQNWMTIHLFMARLCMKPCSMEKFKAMCTTSSRSRSA